MRSDRELQQANTAEDPPHRFGRPSSLRLLEAEAEQSMTEIEDVFRGVGLRGWKAEALSRLRRWEVDPTLTSASRARANELLWKFQPNGWDEV